MGKGRLEAFSDGVIAIIITIMVLDLKAPHAADFGALRPLLPVFLSYVLSFVFVGIYWNNHHHLLHAAEHVDGRILWANLHLLFWLSLIPFVTNWMGEARFGAFSVGIYGVVLLLAAVAFTILTRALIARHGRDSTLAQAVGSDFKGKISLLLYTVGILGVFISPWIGCLMYIIVAAIWIIPDRRIARRLTRQPVQHP